MAHLKTELKKYLLLFLNFSWINGILVRNDTKLNYLLNLFDSDFTNTHISRTSAPQQQKNGQD